jgi:hypothetical protein
VNSAQRRKLRRQYPYIASIIYYSSSRHRRIEWCKSNFKKGSWYARSGVRWWGGYYIHFKNQSDFSWYILRWGTNGIWDTPT